MAPTEQWICQCRQCNGVFTGADAVQYVWEFALGSCSVPVVVGVNATADGSVTCAPIYWWDEPDEPEPITGHAEFIVSCRPGSGTAPTEGDMARWAHWSAGTRPPRDWLLVDDRRFRSVPACAAALRERAPIPVEALIAGDWDGGLDPSWREEIRRNWPDTKRSNRAFRRR